MKIRVGVPAEICLTIEVPDDSKKSIEDAVYATLFEKLGIDPGIELNKEFGVVVYATPVDRVSYDFKEISILDYEG